MIVSENKLQGQGGKLRTNVENGRREFDMTKMSRTDSHAFVALYAQVRSNAAGGVSSRGAHGGAFERAVDGAEVWIVEALLSGLKPSFVLHGC